ncbi:7-cyano-7-deazaguanine synthase [Carboxydocella sporoproducens DSM 16521]|uniref:7-cyano-7-deazaguanine synthase n=3 Tax=Clostridiales Family XVI. Incertae Sedis TaxID=543347 RepID=A0A1T4MRT9_9FIRM|nr:7-cyano-7-deazaguanine synthase [Carboxydocella thermautotrophica]AVX30785.1 7-cyano-7-deazaguanine synthase [Carboxydocella thermautotrophica]SJZ69514.1 7-cyano-7-deazaguanine synthase [Carboxydocella sporoproducens DSM 16521]
MDENGGRAKNMKKAVVLLSGGIDSTVCLALAHRDGYELYPISFDYNQRHKRELDSARQIAEYYHCPRHLIITTNMDAIGGSALTGTMEVPEGDIERKDIPPTYVPARNLIFLSYAVGYAEVVGAERIYIGVNALDYAGYPDCRPEFIQRFQATVDYATKATTRDAQRIEIVTPLINLDKAGIIKLGMELKAPLHLTTTCYRGGEKACGRCDACLLRLQGFSRAGFQDPINYVHL